MLTEDLNGANVVRWCNNCNAEPAVVTVEAEFDGEWTSYDMGEKCLTLAELAGKMEK